LPDPLEQLGPELTKRRRKLGLSLREAADASGIPFATLARVEQGRMPDLETFRRLVAWLGLPPDQFFTVTARTENTPDAIAGHLMADPALPPQAADRIAAVVRDMYQSLASTAPGLAVHLRASRTFTPVALRLLTDLLHDMQAAVDRIEQ